MASPNQLLRLLIESVFVLLGGLIIWVASTGHYLNVDPRSTAWLLLAVLLVIYGLVTVRWRGADREMALTRGGSLVVVGLVMLSLSRATMDWVTPLLIVAGAALVIRGVVVAILLLRVAPKN